MTAEIETRNDLPRCECPTASRYPTFTGWYEDEEKSSWGHAAGECPNQYDMKLMERKGRQAWFCSSCTLPGDVQLPYASRLTERQSAQEDK